MFNLSPELIYRPGPPFGTHPPSLPRAQRPERLSFSESFQRGRRIAKLAELQTAGRLKLMRKIIGGES